MKTETSAAGTKKALRDELARRKDAVRALDQQRAAEVRELQRIEAELEALDETRLNTPLQSFGPNTPTPATAAAKVTLFRTLFRGRDDVYPKLWANTKTDRTGYAPACGNEWVRGVCNKPRVRCGECPHQAFLAVSDQVIIDHLQGRHVVGVYPLLADDTGVSGGGL